MKDICEHILELMRAGQKGILITIVEVQGSVPRHPGSKMVVHSDGRIFGTIGGGKIELKVIKEALAMIHQNQPIKRIYQLSEEEMLCGGHVELVFEPFGVQERLFIFGAGHIGQVLAPLAHQAGFHVSVIDNRSEYANRERFPLPQVDQVLAGDYPTILRQLLFDDQTYIVIVTHGHVHDEEILHFCLQKPFFYLGMIGSKRKTRIMCERLAEKGIEKTLLERVHSPIGFKIGAETPFEISISILAQMIAIRHQMNDVVDVI